MEIRIAIIDDDETFLESFAEYTAMSLGFARPATFSTGRAAVRALSRRDFDVVLVDLMLGRASGSDLIPQIRSLCPKARIVILSGHTDDHLIHEAFGQGAEGYLLKTQPVSDVLRAIREVYAGGVAVERGVFQRVLHRLRNSHDATSLSHVLSAREIEILARVAQGKTYKEIAVEIGLSPFTIYSHTKRIFRKLKVRSKTAAVALFLQGQPTPFPSPAGLRSAPVALGVAT